MPRVPVGERVGIATKAAAVSNARSAAHSAPLHVRTGGDRLPRLTIHAHEPVPSEARDAPALHKLARARALGARTAATLLCGRRANRHPRGQRAVRDARALAAKIKQRYHGFVPFMVDGAGVVGWNSCAAAVRAKALIPTLVLEGAQQPGRQPRSGERVGVPPQHCDRRGLSAHGTPDACLQIRADAFDVAERGGSCQRPVAQATERVASDV